MTIGSGPQAAELRRGYRKGMVLGLTLAEVALLLIFVLLMLLSTGFSRRDKIIAAFNGKVPITHEALVALKASDSNLHQLRKVMNVADDVSTDDFLTLVKDAKVAADMLSKPDVLSALREAKKQRDRVDARLAQIQKMIGENKDSAAVTKTLADQTDQIENQQGQIRQLQDQLANAGAGRVLPSCWTTVDGKTEFIFDVALTSQGLRVAERDQPDRKAARDRLPVVQMDSAQLLSPAEFLARTQQLYQLSLTNNCRYYVVVYDATAAGEKNLYKHLLDTVEGHFYKRKSDGSPPFLVPAGKLPAQVEESASEPET